VVARLADRFLHFLERGGLGLDRLEQSMNIAPMTHRPIPDLPALAAQLRLMALALVVELAEWLGAAWLARAVRRRMLRDLAQLEKFATGIVVLTALRTLPGSALPAPACGARRPGGAPSGFARVQARERAMRAMQRRLFPRERDLHRRLARFDAVLGDLAEHARRLVRHIERIPPASRLVAIAPPAQRLTARAGAAPCAAFDTS